MISVVFALEFESAGFRARFQPRLCVSVWTLGVMGHRTASALEKLIECQRPGIVVSAGFSGALQQEIPVGTVLLGQNVSDPGLLSSLSSENFLVGPLATADAILESAEQKFLFGQQTGALAADLESSHLFSVCQARNIPMLSLRCISDAVDQSLAVPGEVLLDPETGRSDPQAIFRFLFRHPSKAADFARLVRNAKSAQNALASALQTILPILLKHSGGFR